MRHPRVLPPAVLPTEEHISSLQASLAAEGSAAAYIHNLLEAGEQDSQVHLVHSCDIGRNGNAMYLRCCGREIFQHWPSQKRLCMV